MFVLKHLFGKVWSDPNATELVQIQSGQFYLVRSDDAKASRECIFQNAMITVRRVLTAEFHYQLVVTRLFEEGEELLLDEEDETEQERSFLIDEALEFRIGKYEGQPTFQWRDLDDDEDDLYEFVASGVNAPTVTTFELATYRAMYERKYGKSSDDVPESGLKQFAYRPSTNSENRKIRAQEDSQRVSSSSTKKNLPVVISEPATLYLWDLEAERFRLQGEVEASIVENGPRDFWLQADGPETWGSHKIAPELNPKFAVQVHSITWNQLSPRGLQQSYCFRFKDKEAFERFKEAFIKCQYEMLNDVTWEKVKRDEQLYAIRSYDEDVEMREADEDDEEEEEAIESELAGTEEEEEYEHEEEENSQAKAFKDSGVNKQLAVSKDRSYVENQGRIGVFKNSEDTGELQYIATINKLVAPKGKAFVPKKIMLHNQEANMVLQNPENPNSLFNLDIETGKIVEEWKVHDTVTVDYIAPKTKFSQAQPERTLVGASHNALFRIDPRVSGNKMVESEYKQYASKNAFSGMATTANGKIAIASKKGDIRLFDTVGKNAKTALPALGDAIIGVDVTANGRYIIATTETYLLLIDTLIGEGRYKGQLGFDRSFPADAKPMPKRLQLKPEHVLYMDNKVSFTPARFNSTEEGTEENLIVTGNGRFVIAWDFNKVKKGILDKYHIKSYDKRVVQDDFKFGADKDIIVALEDNVLSTNRKLLKVPNRQSLSVTPTRSRSSIVPIYSSSRSLIQLAAVVALLVVPMQSTISQAPLTAATAVLLPSQPVPKDAVSVTGPNFDTPLDLQAFIDSYERIGFQANSLGKAIDIVNKMRKWRLSDETVREDESEEYISPEVRANTKCTVFLGYTSNLISSGLREIILYLVKHKHVSAIVTTAGGIEEDFIKCLGDTYLADFNLDGADLRRKGMNRIGNLIVPNDNYCKFEDWVTPILDKLLEEQQTLGTVWTPSTVIRRLGKEINDERSVYHWAYKNDIPVFCPALTDGSLGDMIYFHSFRSPGLIIDIVRDIRALNDLSLKAKKAGMIILGGGVCKHQIANAMLIRNGADFSVYINTGQEFDGSDSGARPEEAVSWGKIRAGSESVKVFADATLVFPLLVAATFARTQKT